jgi:hypothetical protein
VINTVICTTCRKELHWKRSGVLVLFMNGSEKPERAAYADLFKCDCGAEVLTGFGMDVPLMSIQDCINSESKSKNYYQIPMKRG